MIVNIVSANPIVESVGIVFPLGSKFCHISSDLVSKKVYGYKLTWETIQFYT